MDADAVYQQAVRKLRLLLSAASEAASSSLDEEDNSLSGMRAGGGVDDMDVIGPGGDFVGVGGLTDPPVKRRFNRNQKQRRGGGNTAGAAAAARRSLNFGQVAAGASSLTSAGDRERHNSWHNLLHIDDGGRMMPGPAGGGDPRTEELSLLSKQEAYIKQLEGETAFCRQQLALVLRNVKGTVAAAEADRGEQGKEEAAMAADTVSRLRAENARLASELQDAQLATGEEETPLTRRLRQEGARLKQDAEKARAEAEEVRLREEEAAEQVKRSVQAAEQLKMEKSEMEYEAGQLRMQVGLELFAFETFSKLRFLLRQVDRQQARIRGLIEEQASKADEELASAERRAQEQVRAAREEQGRAAEESARLSAQLEVSRRAEAELRRQVEDRDQLMGDVKRETEKRLSQLQGEAARAASARGEAERRAQAAAAEAERARQELKAEAGRFESEAKALRGRVARAEEELLRSRQEALELAEDKAVLQREMSLVRTAAGGGEVLLPSRLKEDTKSAMGGITREQVASAKLEDLVRRQSRIIGELKHQCMAVADRLEETASVLEEERRSFTSRASRLEDAASLASLRATEAERRLEERGSIHGELCRRLQESDLAQGRMAGEVRRTKLLCEELRQERAMAEQEAEFLRGLLRSRGMLPEKDRGPAGKSPAKTAASPPKKKIAIKAPELQKSRPQAIVIERNGKTISPPVKQ